MPPSRQKTQRPHRQRKADGLYASIIWPCRSGSTILLPRFSWQLQDSSARCLAERIHRCRWLHQRRTACRKPSEDVWTSGRINSSQSIERSVCRTSIETIHALLLARAVVGCGGQVLARRAQPNWWELGLLDRRRLARAVDRRRNCGGNCGAPCTRGMDHQPRCARNCHGERKKNRAAFCLPDDRVSGQAGSSCDALPATGQDTVSAWMNGAQVLERRSRYRRGSSCPGRSLYARRMHLDGELNQAERSKGRPARQTCAWTS